MAKNTPSTPKELEVLWVGHPWIAPRFVAETIALLVVAAVLTFAEFTIHVAFLSIAAFPLLLVTYGALGVIWVFATLDLLILRATHKYVLRQSSMDISNGIITQKTYSLSAAGFSDLEVVQGILGRIIGMGDIVMETDSNRDVRLIMIHRPTDVAARIKMVMATPMVRIAPEIPPAK